MNFIGVSFSTCCLLFNLLLMILFFARKRMNNVETKIYSYLLIITFTTTTLSLPMYFSTMYHMNIGIYADIITKFYLVLLTLWLTLLDAYFLFITNHKIEEKKYVKKLKKVGVIYYIIILLFIIILPIKYSSDVNMIYTYGPSVNVSFIVGLIADSVFIYCIIREIRYSNRQKAFRNKKFFPLFAMLVIGATSAILQKINPSWLFMTTTISIVIHIMYNTIENPDMKMLEEIKKSKDLAEQSNTEKAMFLYNTSQEIKRPVQAIEEKCGEMLDEYELSDDLKEDLRDIKFAAKRLSTTINGVLDMNNSTKNTNIEIMHKKYNIKNLFKEITSMSKISITEQEKKLEFRSNIDDSIPEYLMGDSIRLKQIITTIVNNAIKHTCTGFIEFNISYVVKHNNCRLIMSVEDSGEGIESSKLETLFYGNEDDLDDDGTYKVDDTRKSLSFIKVLTNLIGGTVIVNSELGKGSKFTVVLDQEISQEEKSSTMIAIEKLNSTKKILVVDDEEESLKQITKLLNKYDVNVDTVMWGQECLERIRKNQKYDLILLDEDMPRLNGIKTFEKLKIEDNFDIPVVIMINESHIEYKDRYLLNGFGGVLVKPLNKKELDKIMDKYIKVDE